MTTKFSPTVIGKKMKISELPVAIRTVQTDNLPIVLPDSFPAVLSNEQLQEVKKLLSRFDFMSMTLQEIAVVGSEDGTEKEMHHALDNFLSRVGEFDNPKIFKLLEALSEAVEAEDLAGLADRILEEKVTLLDRAKGFLRGKRGKDILGDAWEETKKLIQAKGKTLQSVVGKMELELAEELSNLEVNVRFMEEIRETYQQYFEKYLVIVAFVNIFLARSKKQVEKIQESFNQENDISQQRQIDILRDKLAALESRALALEGTLTGLPADDLVLRQLQNAGISSWQEITTSVPARFAKIKGTLLMLNSAMIIRGVQQIDAQGKKLDQCLQIVNAKMTKEVVHSAMNASGENRIAQAKQLQEIARDIGELKKVVAESRQSNEQKFAETRQILADVRKSMLSLSA